MKHHDNSLSRRDFLKLLQGAAFAVLPAPILFNPLQSPLHQEIPVYLLRDQFLTDSPSLVASRVAEPGPGTATIIGDQFSIVNGRLRGSGTQDTTTWGSHRIVYDGFERQNGRTLVALISPEDAGADFAFGWATKPDITDPRTDGHGFLSDTQGMYAIQAGQKVPHDADLRGIRPIQYLIAHVLQQTGAITLVSSFSEDAGAGRKDALGIPQYPQARILWVNTHDTTPILYPYLSYLDTLGYPLGHAVEDFRVLDVPEYGQVDALASFADRFDRPDHTTEIGNGWASSAGRWGLSSGMVTITDGQGFMTAAHAAQPDGLFCFEAIAPTSGAWGFIIRQIDANNYVRIWNDGQNAISIQTWVNGAFGTHISSTGYTWTPGETYQLLVSASGNQYRIWINGHDVLGGWVTDSSSAHLQGAGIGFLTANVTDTRWGKIAAYPHTVTLPPALQAGAHPAVLSGDKTLALDTFTADDGTPLANHTPEQGGAWTIHSGDWTIVGNRAAVALTEGYGRATQDIGLLDVECELVAATPEVFTGGVVRVGIVARYLDERNFLDIRLFKDPGQPQSDEIELIEVIDGQGAIIHKVNLGDYYQPASTYTLTVQCKGDLVQVMLDGKARISYYTAPNAAQGTRFGMYREYIGDGSRFETWTVRELIVEG